MPRYRGAGSPRKRCVRGPGPLEGVPLGGHWPWPWLIEAPTSRGSGGLSRNRFAARRVQESENISKFDISSALTDGEETVDGA